MIRRRHQSCSLKFLKQMHAVVVVKSLTAHSPILRNLLLLTVASLSRPGCIAYALKLFDEIPKPDIFLWNCMIRGLAHASDPKEAVVLYTRMMDASVIPDSFTFIFLLKACTRLSSPFAGAQLHSIVTKLGHESDAYIRNALINLHAHCGDLTMAVALFDGPATGDVVARSSLMSGLARRGRLADARRLFDEFPQRDVVSVNLMIAAHAKQGDMTTARDLLDRAPEKDIVSWNTVLAGYMRCRRHTEALQLFEEMQRQGLRPGEHTISTMLSSCAASGDLDMGQTIHAMISPNNTLVANTLIHMYAKCGRIDRAVEVFRSASEKDAWSWNSIIGGLALNGRAQECMSFFLDMKRDGVRPGVKHYGCVVDMLGRTGRLREAMAMVQEMKTEPNEIIWRTLLGACRMHDDMEMARRVDEELRKMGWEKSNDYVLLSNALASDGRWNAAEELRRLMDSKGWRKEAGCTQV